MVRPSLRSWFAPALLLLLLGLGLGNVVLLAGGMFLLISTLLATAMPPPSGVVVERRLPRSISWAGDTLTVDRQLTVHRGVGPVYVYDALPSEARVADGSNFRVVWKWPGRKSADISYQIAFPKRGRFALPEVRWESQSPFGFRSASGRAGSTLEISVVPRVRSVNRLNEVRVASRSQRFQDDIAKTGASTNEFRELRPYQPGDSIRRINWKASARTSGVNNLPLVNELEPETKKSVWIFLDMANYMDVGVPLSNPRENTVAASGALAQYYLWKGFTLGAFAYNTYGAAGELLSPESGRKQFNRLVHLLTSVKPGSPRQDLLQAMERCKDFLFRLHPDVYIITRLDVHYSRLGQASESLDRFRTAVTRLTALRARSRKPGRVRVVHVAPQEPASDSRTRSLVKWETRVVAGTLRRAGAVVMEWEPDSEDFTTALVRHVGMYG